MLGINPDLMATAATIYGVGAAAAALLQARQILRSKGSCDVSARFFASYAGGYAIWLLYGMSIQSAPLVLVDAIGLLCGGFTLATTLALRGSLVSPKTWNSCRDGRRSPTASTPGYGSGSNSRTPPEIPLPNEARVMRPTPGTPLGR